MQHNEEDKQTDIVMLPENASGHDHVIGDVHGGLPRFKEWLASIGPNDRGFCVGDLVDRGKDYDNQGVVMAIIEHNSQPDKGKIYAVRGNHEEMCLNAIREMTDLLRRIGKNGGSNEGVEWYSDECVNYIENNGGVWLEQLFDKEIQDGLIQYNDETGEVEFSNQSQVKAIENFIDTLPYVLKVDGSLRLILYMLTCHSMIMN